MNQKIFIDARSSPKGGGFYFLVDLIRCLRFEKVLSDVKIDVLINNDECPLRCYDTFADTKISIFSSTRLFTRAVKEFDGKVAENRKLMIQSGGIARWRDLDLLLVHNFSAFNDDYLKCCKNFDRLLLIFYR